MTDLALVPRTVIPRGPLMIDCVGTELNAEDIARLNHPLVGGVILFARNYQNPAQVRLLVAAIHEVRAQPLIVAVDHEGGRVQRFREGFSVIPAMRTLGLLYEQDPKLAITESYGYGRTIAQELVEVGVDLNFAPILDLDCQRSAVIGDRAFHNQPAVVAALANAYIQGLRAGGLPSVGKHFPGHGYVEADSHHSVPVDQRTLAEIWSQDLIPYRRLIMQRCLDAVMPAHVIYDQVDAQPAGFSSFWLQQILRQDLRFSGAIFSDDLAMAGAEVAGGIVARAKAALAAGCDMLLVCNQSALIDTLLEQWQPDLTDWMMLSRPRIDKLLMQSRR